MGSPFLTSNWASPQSCKYGADNDYHHKNAVSKAINVVQCLTQDDIGTLSNTY